MAMSLEALKKITADRSSTANPENLAAKINPVDVELIGLTEIVKIYETKAVDKPAFWSAN